MVYFDSRLQSAVQHGRQGMLTGACSGCSHYYQSQEEESKMNVRTQPVFSWFESWTPVQMMILPTFRPSLPSSVKLFWNHPHRLIQWYILMLILKHLNTVLHTSGLRILATIPKIPAFFSSVYLEISRKQVGDWEALT